LRPARPPRRQGRPRVLLDRYGALAAPPPRPPPDPIAGAAPAPGAPRPDARGRSDPRPPLPSLRPRGVGAGPRGRAPRRARPPPLRRRGVPHPDALDGADPPRRGLPPRLEAPLRPEDARHDRPPVHRRLPRRGPA